MSPKLGLTPFMFRIVRHCAGFASDKDDTPSRNISLFKN
jgi:hypothetical protein